MLETWGGFFLLLVSVFLFGRFWFALVEGMLSFVKKRLFGPKETMDWHTWEEIQEEKEKGSKEQNEEENEG